MRKQFLGAYCSLVQNIVFECIMVVGDCLRDTACYMIQMLLIYAWHQLCSYILYIETVANRVLQTCVYFTHFYITYPLLILSFTLCIEEVVFYIYAYIALSLSANSYVEWINSIKFWDVN